MKQTEQTKQQTKQNKEIILNLTEYGYTVFNTVTEAVSEKDLIENLVEIIEAGNQSNLIYDYSVVASSYFFEAFDHSFEALTRKVKISVPSSIYERWQESCEFGTLEEWVSRLINICGNIIVKK